MRHQAPCPTCFHSTRRGLLWLGGSDWLECPTCETAGQITIHEQRFVPTERTISIPGAGTIQAPVHHPTMERCM